VVVERDHLVPGVSDNGEFERTVICPLPQDFPKLHRGRVLAPVHQIRFPPGPPAAEQTCAVPAMIAAVRADRFHKGVGNALAARFRDMDKDKSLLLENWHAVLVCMFCLVISG
jgi:hypothetical protein